MQLTQHFSLEEFEFSTIAFARGFNNKVPESLIPSLTTLCREVLEPLRAIVKEPIIISSGYRCPQLNRLVGGSPTSQHMKGEACNIHLPDQSKLREWFTYLMDGQFDQLIMERASRTSNRYWIHVSCKRDPAKNRHLVLYLTKTK